MYVRGWPKRIPPWNEWNAFVCFELLLSLDYAYIVLSYIQMLQKIEEHKGHFESLCMSAKCRSARASAAGEISVPFGVPSLDRRPHLFLVPLSLVHGDPVINTLVQVDIL